MAHQINWFAVYSASYILFTGKGLAFNLVPDPAHAVLRRSSDFTTLKVAHNLINNLEFKCFQKEKKSHFTNQFPKLFNFFFAMSSQFNHWNWIIKKIYSQIITSERPSVLLKNKCQTVS